MVRLEYFNTKEWVHCGEYPNEKMAWISLGGDDLNYRTIDDETEEVLTDKSE